MSDLVAAEARWHEWIESACAAVGVDPQVVDVAMVHALTRDIAHEVARPMAPVGSFILGVALGQAAGGHAAGGRDVERVLAALRATIPTAAPGGPRG